MRIFHKDRKITAFAKQKCFALTVNRLLFLNENVICLVFGGILNNILEWNGRFLGLGFMYHELWIDS